MKVDFDKTTFAVLSTICGICLTSCYHGGEIIYTDPWIKMHEYEMVDKIQNAKNRKIKNKENGGKIRSSDIVYDPEEPKAIQDKIVSINVTEETPIVDVIMELARMSGTDVQIDPTIVGGVNLSLKDKPLRYVFNRICGLTDTRYDEKYGIVVFQKDMPYAKTYNIDFLDVSRDTSSSMTLNTSGLSTNSSSGGNGTSTVTTKSTDSFWDDIVKDIQQIIQTTENTNKIYTTTAERIQRIAKDKEEENKLQEDINNGIYNKNIDSSFSSKNNSSTAQSSKINDKVSDEIIRVNKRAGIITITASTKSHRIIEKYLQQLKKKYSAQVLIEMRFLEVNLKKEYEAGIDWSLIFKKHAINTSLKQVAGLFSKQGLNFVWNGGLDTTAALFEEFGSTRTLSNPRINAMNNQPALMTFAKNYVYFKTKSTYTPGTYDTTSGAALTPGYRNVESESQTMPLGVIMSVLPSIDVDKGEIILNIKPTISKLEETVEDPAVTVVLNDDNSAKDSSEKNKVPVASVRELDTILKLKDGQTAVIGGFTERYGEVTEKGIPVVRAIPLIGSLFENKYNKTTSTETIILVKATIVNNGKKISEYDKGVYDAFSDDPRMNEV